jgi:pimeloyl-ACP methyl ester carboxylesterase
MQRAHGLEYETRGDGDAVLCMHGAIISDSFEPLMREPDMAGFQLIRYRRRGYGNSETPAVPPTVADQVSDARALLQHLDVEHAHVVAHSGGGPIAVQLTLDAPDTVRSLVLLEPALQNASMAAAFHELVTPLIDMHRAGNSSKAVHMWMRTVSGSGWRTELEEWIPGVGERANADAAGTFEYDLEALRLWDFDAAGASRIRQPALHIVGARSAVGRQAVTEMFLAAVPHAEQVTIAGSDHSLQMTHPATVAFVIAEFLGRHPIGVRER